ncbi:MAG TPA: outer membrane beta-barrel protein [Stellaceae bacterium]|nr:outer membrane beta-barrel protein [Stellaceae bacterium]
MNHRFLTGAAVIALMAGLSSVSPAQAQTPAPAPAAAPAPMATPAMAGPITANPNPYSIDLGPILGKTYIGGALTGMGFAQNNTVPSAGTPAGHSTGADLTNGSVEIQKIDGLVQYYLQAGAYSFPVVGQGYVDTSHTNTAMFGPLPLAYAKLVPNSALSFEVGKLPTLIGEELPFTYENLNIQRGLLWNQENLINRGIQANYAVGPLSFSLSLNDGYYSKRYTYLTGLAQWTVTSADTLILAGGGNTKTVDAPLNGSGTVSAVDNTQQVDLSYTHTQGPWMFNPYIQYTHTPGLPAAGVVSGGSTMGIALLATYTFDPSTMVGGLSLGGFSLPARVEYISSHGNANSPNLVGYGPGSNAWEITVTPTYQYNIFFARPELSYIAASSITTGTPGSAFGATGNKKGQFRALLEAGFVF